VIGCIPWPSMPTRKRDRPCVYCKPNFEMFIVRLWFRLLLDSNNVLYTFPNTNYCQFDQKKTSISMWISIHSLNKQRRTFDNRQLKTISTDIKQEGY